MRDVEKVFDAHVHLSEHRDDALVRFARVNGLSYTLDELLTTMRSNNVTHGLLLSPPLQGSGCLSNDEVVKLCAKSGTMLSPVVTVEPSYKEVTAAIKFAEENQREVKAFKVRLGYVNASAENPVFGKLYDYAEAEGLPVLFHTGDTAFSNGDLARSHPLTLDRLANKRERLTVVLCHFGNPWFDDVAELIYKHQNVYTDTSGLITGESEYPEKYAAWLAEKINGAIYYAGSAEKILFGTDYPVSKHSDALDLIMRLQVDERDKERILWGNAERLFNL
jgi:predicted TIM-barrel fold metal-dependent hydrolase